MNILAQWWTRWRAVRALRSIADQMHNTEGLLLTFPTMDPEIAAKMAYDRDADPDGMNQIQRFNAELHKAAEMCHRAGNIADALAEVRSGDNNPRPTD